MIEPVISHSETVTKIVPAMLAAKKVMGPLLKNAENPHFKNKYADLGASIDVVDPALQANGILMVQAPGGDGDTIALETLLIHESGEWFRSVLTMTPAKKADPQAAGSVITYARRYSIQGLFSLAADDDDANAGSGKGGKSGDSQGSTQGGRRSQPAGPGGIDPNALLMRAVELQIIPKPDRIMFKEWARTKVAGCANLADNEPLTTAQLEACEKALAAVKAPLRAVPDQASDKDAAARQRDALRVAIMALCRTLKLTDDQRHDIEKHHHILGLRAEVIGQVPITLLENMRDDLIKRTGGAGDEDPDDVLAAAEEAGLL